MPPHATYPYTGRFIVRLTPTAVDRIIQWKHAEPALALDDLRQLACTLELTELCTILTDYRRMVISPVVGGASFDRVLELEANAEHSPYPPVHRLASYYVLDPREGLSQPEADRLLGRLLRL
jgi:hypothetical protein